MPFKIEPHAIEQDKGPFPFPGIGINREGAEITHPLTVYAPLEDGNFTQRNIREVAAEWGAAAGFDLVTKVTGSTISPNLGAGFLFSIMASDDPSPTFIAGVYGIHEHGKDTGRIDFWTKATGTWAPRTHMASDGLHFKADRQAIFATGSISLMSADDLVGLGTLDPARTLHLYGATGTYSRIEVPGAGLAAQREFLRGASYSWLGPTAGNEFHLWSQEDIPLVLGLDNTEVQRWHGDGFTEWTEVTASPTGTAVDSQHIRTWAVDALVGDNLFLHMNDAEDRMAGSPQGFYAVANTAATVIAATPTYTKMPWWWLFRGNLQRTPIGMLTHDTSGGETDIIIRDSGIFEIHVQITTEVTSGVTPTSCHGYIDKGGSKLTGTDLYTYNVNATNGFDTGATMWVGRLVAGDIISVKMTKAVGTNTVQTLSGGTRILIRQVAFSN